MEALKASYASSSDEEGDYSNTHAVPQKKPRLEEDETTDVVGLPPPPLNALDFPSKLAYKNGNVGNRIRSFPHVEGNYALHVYIPVNIPSIAKKELAPLVKKAGMLVPELYAIDTDLPICSAQMKNKDSDQVEGVALANQYHISLSRTVAIRVHQIDSIVTILRHKLHSQKRYWIEFGKWEVFINDDQTRSFLAMEVTAEGLSEIVLGQNFYTESGRFFLQKRSLFRLGILLEIYDREVRFRPGDRNCRLQGQCWQICKQIHAVDEVFRMHNLPEFYKNPRPHISVAWSLDNHSQFLRQAAGELNRLRGNFVKRSIWSYMCSGIECKIGQKTYPICKLTAP